jgi:hypothetical protein
MLPSSCTLGSRHPARPPMTLVLQWLTAVNQLNVFRVLGLCSHTSPVSLSRTPAPPNAGKTVKRPLVNVLDHVGNPEAPAARAIAGKESSTAITNPEIEFFIE